jgi:multiple sugar transport system permease protein
MARITSVLGGLARHLTLIFFGVFFALPLFWMLSTALKTDVEVLKHPPVWFPGKPMWSNFPEAFVFVPFSTFLKNSVIIATLSVLGALFSCTLSAYGFARLEWRGRDVLFGLVLSTLMLPYQVTMIPLYVIFNQMGWVNTLYPLIVPNFFGNAFYIFLLRQFFLGIPRDLSDSARIDGCTELGILLNIILPLAKPALMVVALFQFLSSWNAFLGPLIYLSDKNLYTISLGLALMQSGYGLSRFSLIMAATSIFVVPVIILFFFAQRTFIQGITFTGLKG